jgi:hypothetical protein
VYQPGYQVDTGDQVFGNSDGGTSFQSREDQGWPLLSQSMVIPYFFASEKSVSLGSTWWYLKRPVLPFLR